MKIGFIGCVNSSKLALETLLSIQNEGVEVVAVVTKKQSPFNADHVDLMPICNEHQIPCHYEESNQKNDTLKFMQQHKPDVIYCFGWSYLLSNDFLNMAAHGVIGFHPAKLPQNRGRHPIIWALALGLDATASTFFKMEEGADTGPILSQVDIAIERTDDAKSLYNKILESARLQILDFTRKLKLDNGVYVEQNHSLSNNWRKRSRKDGLIDWRMRAEDIHNLIRALTRPYPGAEFEYQKEMIQVWNSKLSEKIFPRNIEPGFIIEIIDNNILVKCSADTAIWLVDVELEHTLKVGDYL